MQHSGTTDNIPQPPGPASPGDDVSAGEEVRATLMALMPWGISLFFHLALVGGAVGFVWQVILQPEDAQPVIPEARFSQTPGAPDLIQTVREEAAAAPRTTPTSNPTVQPPSPIVSNTQIQATSIGLTHAGGITGGTFGNVTGGSEFRTNLFGSGGNARNIAFVVDASGSMIGVLPFVINELKRVINSELREAQRFTVIFFTGEGVFEVPGGGARRGLRPATATFKQEVSSWMALDQHNIQSAGSGSVNAIAAIRQALRSRPRPHLVYLLSDNLTGGGQGAAHHEIFQSDVLDAIRDANDTIPPAKINTIQFIYADPLVDAGLTGTLEQIANETGGVYKFLGERELNLR